jgi:hypothetical protein
MATQVVVTLQDEVYRRVERLAQLPSCDVAELLADTMTLSLPALDASMESGQAVTVLSDEEVLALTALQMPPAQDRRLSTVMVRRAWVAAGWHPSAD